MRYLFTYVPLLIFVILIQRLFNIVFNQFPLQPDLVLIFCVYTAHYNGKLIGQGVGFFAGICEDILSISPFGVSMIHRTVVAFIMGHTSQWQIQNVFIVPIILITIALIIKYITNIIIGALFAIENLIVHAISVNVLYEAIATIILTPILFSLLSIVPKIKKEEKW